MIYYTKGKNNLVEGVIRVGIPIMVVITSTITVLIMSGLDSLDIIQPVPVGQ